MVQHFLQNLQTLRLDEIDAEDRFFATSLPWISIDRLIESIRANGILSPLHLHRRSPHSHRVVMGWRRFRAAREVGLTEIPCVLREESDLELFLSAVRENAATRPLHPLEKAGILLKLHRHFEVSPESLLGKFLPMLEIPPQRFQLERYLSLARLPEALQKAVFQSLEPEIALRLGLWPPEEQAFFLSRISHWELGKNKQKQLFALLDELRAGQNAGGPPEKGSGESTLDRIWEQSGCAAVEKDERVPPADRFDQVLERLVQLRYPHLSEHQKQYQTLKSALRLPPQIQLHAPPYFEGSRLDVAFSFGTSEELSRLGGKLQEIAEKEELKRILDLL